VTATVSALRAILAEAIKSVVDDRTTVYRTSVEGLAGFPAIVLGMPSWKPAPIACGSTWDFPVAVIVARPGTSDSATVSELDELWPTVLDALLDLRGRGLDDVTAATFGMFNVQGQDYPAQVLTCSLTTTT
jgi:hypothetical protein